MYESLGYSVFRRVRGYYSGGVKDGEEDAFGVSPLAPQKVEVEAVRRYAESAGKR